MIYIILLILILISLFKNKNFFKIKDSYFNLIIYFDNYIIKFYNISKNIIIFNKKYG